jgi:hypothetical protein
VERLPLELIAQILDAAIQVAVPIGAFDVLTDGGDGDNTRVLSRLSTVSAKWQKAVDAINFHDISLISVDWEQFVKTFSPCRRRRNSRTLGKITTCEALEGDGVFHENFGQCDPRTLDLYWKDMALTVRIIWNELHSWGNDLCVSSLRVIFPEHPCVYRMGGKSDLRPGLPNIDLSKYYDVEYVLPTLQWVETPHVSAKASRISPGYLWHLASSLYFLEVVGACSRRERKKKRKISSVCSNRYVFL